MLVDPDLPDGAGVAAGLGLHGAVVAEPSGEEPGVVGGGLSPALVGPGWPPRPSRFFWAFPGEAPAGADASPLAALGVRLTGGAGQPVVDAEGGGGGGAGALGGDGGI